MAYSNNNLFVAPWGLGVFLSNDNGSTYTEVNNGLQFKFQNKIFINGSDMYVGSFEGVALSTNNGTSWQAVNTGLTSLSTTSFAAIANNVYAGTSGGVFVTTNKGSSWTATLNTGLTNTSVSSLLLKDNFLFAGTSNGVFVSSNNGSNWTEVSSGLSNKSIRCLAVVGTKLFAGTNSGLFISSNNGSSWQSTSIPSILVYDIAAIGGTVVAVTDKSVYSSNDSGVLWKEDNGGLPSNAYLTSVTNNSTTFFLGTFGHSVFKRDASTITSVENNYIPNNFSLFQNYPNPFNPSTVISYQLPTKSNVTLIVYDNLGRKVTTLVNEEKLPGKYEVKFDGRKLSSGIYFYKLQSESFTQTKKLILMK
jgi:ligand-binding sensor domain-containing protein